MKLGISAFAWTSKFSSSHLRLIPAVKEMGFDGLEIAMFDPSDLAISDLRSEFSANDLDCTVCAILPPGVNPISPDRAARKYAASHLVRCIEATAEMGATVIGGPLYAPIGYLPDHRPTPDEWSWAIEAFQSLGEVLDSHDVSLCIEPVNRSETFLLRTAKEAKHLCETINHPRVGVTIDTFHANIEERNIADAMVSLGPLLKHVHISENDRSLLGTGHVDFQAIISALNSSGYNGYLMIEGFGFSPDETNGPGVLWADRSVSPEEIAMSGARYLRSILRDLQ
jgi:D-psicose/D-tagatose/L-ribulose 3-epimerase